MAPRKKAETDVRYRGMAKDTAMQDAEHNITEAQRVALAVAARSEGGLLRFTGAGWCGTARNLRGRWPAADTVVALDTVQALEQQVLLERVYEYGDDAVDTRRLTDAGRAAFEKHWR